MRDEEKTREELLAELVELRETLAGHESGARLLESEETARALFNAPHDSALLVEPDGTIVTANRWAAESFRTTVEALEGQNVFRYFPEDVGVRRRPFGEEAVSTGKPVRQVDQRAGRWFDYTIYPIHDAAGERVVRFAIFARDITEQKEMASTLQKSEEKYRNLVEQSQQGISVIQDGRFAFVNRALTRIVGYTAEELLAMTPKEVGATIHPEDREAEIAHIEAILAGESELSTREFRVIRRDGIVRWLRVSASRIEYEGRPASQGIMLDVDDSKRLEQRIAQAAKLEAVGRLAGGVAHDFNNLLTAILGYGKSMVKKMSPDDPLLDSAREISYAADRAAALTRQLLAFSREQRLEPKRFNVNDVVREMENVLASLLGAGIRMDIRLSAGLDMVMADPGQLEQVLMNLVLNARDAMKEGGRLTIETSGVGLTAEELRDNPDAVPGDFVRLAVRDTGTGLDEKQKRTIFEPFFSTKGLTEGTGLGLSVVYGIVRQHGGVITVESEPGRGSCFCVFLPRADGAVAAGEGGPMPPEQNVRTGRRALVVEDERVVRRFITMTLKEHGFEVAEAASAEEAEERCGPLPGNFDLLLVDVMLPGKSGIQLVKELTAGRADLAAVLASGYAIKESQLDFVRVSRYPFLEKPFTDEELMAAVRMAFSAAGLDGSFTDPSV